MGYHGVRGVKSISNVDQSRELLSPSSADIWVLPSRSQRCCGKPNAATYHLLNKCGKTLASLQIDKSWIYIWPLHVRPPTNRDTSTSSTRTQRRLSRDLDLAWHFQWRELASVPWWDRVQPQTDCDPRSPQEIGNRSGILWVTLWCR